MRSPVVVIAIFTCATASADVGVRIGIENYAALLSVSPGPRTGTTLVAGCLTSYTLSDPSGSSATAAGLLTGVLRGESWDAWSDTNQGNERGLACSAIARFDETGALYVTGIASEHVEIDGKTLSGGHAGDFGYIAKLDRLGGKVVWSHVASSKVASWNEPTALALGPDHALAVAGWFKDDIDWGAGRVAARGSEDGYVIVLDRDTGAIRWTVASGKVAALGFAPAGALVTAANIGMAHGSQLYVTAYEPRGTRLWQTHTSGSGDINAEAIAFAPDGDIAIVGSLRGAVTLGRKPLAQQARPPGTQLPTWLDTDALALRLRPDGVLRTATTWQATEHGRLHGAAFVGDELWVGGTFRNHIALDGTVLDAPTPKDDVAFVARVTELGAVDRAALLSLPDEPTEVSMFADGADLVMSGTMLVEHPNKTADSFFLLRWNRSGAPPAATQLALPTADRYLPHKPS